MKNTFWIAIILIALVSVGVFLLPSWGPTPPVVLAPVALPADPSLAVYTIDEVSVDLSTSTSTELFGQPIIGDLNGDGTKDAAVMLQDQPGGTGTFYYVAVAINTGHGYQGTNAIFLGDRIAPQTLEIRGATVIANYAERKPDESFTTRPSVGVSLYAQLEGEALVQIPTKK